MAREEHEKKYGNTSSQGGRSKKKMQQNKVPQRGLGVAQLEKIRLEEQQKKGVFLQAANLLSPSNSSTRLADQCSTFWPSISSCPSVPLPPSSPPSDLPSPNSFFRPIPSIPDVDIWPKVWKDQRFDHHGFAYRCSVDFPFGSSNPTPFLSLSNALQRSQQFQPPSSSLMVNISSGISSSHTLNFQMEPPSNQNLCSSNCTPPLWPDEEKMIGMKRPFPFSMETPLVPAFHFKYPPSYDDPLQASCSNRCSGCTELEFSVIREGASRSSNQAESFHTEVKIRQNGSLNGDFLTLAPPAAAAPNLSSQCRDFLANSSFPQSSSEFGSQPTQCSSEDSIQGQQFSKPMRPPFFSFFPAAKNQVGQEPTPANSCNGEFGENVDLSLKL